MPAAQLDGEGVLREDDAGRKEAHRMLEGAEKQRVTEVNSIIRICTKPDQVLFQQL